MVNLEELRVRGLHAYELGRWRAASRIAIALIPLAGLCLLETKGREACACLAVLLIAVAIVLRWRSRRGAESVATGLLAGSFPLAAGMIVECLGLQCGLAGESALCTTFALLVGALAGSFIAFRESGARGQLSSWLTAAVVATLAASLGCVRLGIVGVASVVLGIGVGCAAMRVSKRIAGQHPGATR